MASLTQKQWEAVDLLLDHMTSKEIARKLGISPHTVDQRIESAMRKMAVGSRRELARTLAARRQRPIASLPARWSRLLRWGRRFAKLARQSK